MLGRGDRGGWMEEDGAWWGSKGVGETCVGN